MIISESKETIFNQNKDSYDEPIPQHATVGYYAQRVREIISKQKPEWSPTDLRDCLAPELATQMHLWPLIEHLPCPDELNRKTDLRYVAWSVYPETKTVSEIDLIREVFNGIISGDRKKFPQDYFCGPKANARAKLIFKLFMNEYAIPRYDIRCLQDAYEVFASSEINTLIDKCHLSAFVQERFGIPLNFLHTCLENDADDIAYYNMFFRRLRNPKRSRFLLTGYQVSQLNGGVLPKEYEEYVEYQEELERKNTKVRRNNKQ